MSGSHPSHVALVVASLAAARERLSPLSPSFAPVEARPREGAVEQYVGLEGSAALLLCQPTGAAGPYASALARRGPGLHHVGLSVADLAAYLAGLAGSGWYVLPQTVVTVPRGVVWLARPGVQALVEVCEMADAAAPPFVSLVEIPIVGARGDLLHRLGTAGRPLAGVAPSPDQRAWLTIAGTRFAADELARA